MKPNIKIIPSSWLEKEGRRLDCGPYLSGAVEAKVLLAKLATQRLQELTLGGLEGIYNGPQFVRNYVVDSQYGVPFLTTSSMLRADLSSIPLLRKKDAFSARLKFLEVKEAMTLITCSGTIGRMAYTRGGMQGMWSNQDILKIVPDPEKLHPGYLYAYLSSRFGIPIVISGTYGAVVQHIEPQHIAELPVPRLGSLEETCHGLIQESASLLDQYQQGIVRATDTFFDSVGLKDISPAEWHSAGPDLGFFQSFPRQDSLRGVNFNPRFKKLCDRMKEAAWKPLNDICIPGTLKRGGRYKRIDADPEYAYLLVGQKQLFWLRPEGRWIARSALGPEVLVEPGTILVAAQGTLGESELYCRSEFTWGPSTENAYSEHLLRVIADPSVMPRGCLYAFMRSETAFRMLRSISMGTKLQDHHHHMLPELPVPYPPKDAQAQIHSMIVEAYEARHRAVALEREAIELVENAIMGEA